MKPLRGVFSARPHGDESNGNQNPRPADAPPEIEPGLVPPRPGPKHLLWEVLVELGFVDERRVLEAEAVARASRQDLGAVLLEREMVTGEQLARAVAQREGVLFADLAVYGVDERAASLITPAVAERYGAIPIGFGPGGEVLLALSNPRERHAVNDIAMMVEPSITRVVATQESIDELIRIRKEMAYEGGAGQEPAGSEPEPELTPDVPEGPHQEDPELTAIDDPATADESHEPAPQTDGLSANGSASWFDTDPSATASGANADADENAWGSDRLVEAEDPHPEPAKPDEVEAQPIEAELAPAEVAEEAPSDEEPALVSAPAMAAAPEAVARSFADRELLESLTRSMGEVERLVRESAETQAAELDATGSESEHRLAELRADLEHEQTAHVETERTLREQLESERSNRDETERKLRDDAEVERATRESVERGLREELESERAARAEAERGLREELESERATREALAAEIAAVRTARDDLARRVAGARDLLEQAARPFVPLNGRER